MPQSVLGSQKAGLGLHQIARFAITSDQWRRVALPHQLPSFRSRRVAPVQFIAPQLLPTSRF